MGTWNRDTSVKRLESAIEELKEIFRTEPRELYMDPVSKNYTEKAYEKVKWVFAKHKVIGSMSDIRIRRFLDKHFILR